MVDKTRERSFIMMKPDAIQRGLVHKIIGLWEKKGFKLVAMKFTEPGKKLFEAHYAEHKARPFFPDLIKFATSGPVCAMGGWGHYCDVKDYDRSDQSSGSWRWHAQS